MGLDIMYINGREIFYTILILTYIFGGLGLLLYYFRPGINPNILLISIFWPIYAILSIVCYGYNLLINHKDA